MAVDHVRHPLAIPITQLLSRDGRIATGQILVDDEENILQCIHERCPVHTIFFSDDCELPKFLKDALPHKTSLAVVARRTAKTLFGNERRSRIFVIARTPRTFPLAQLATGHGDMLVLDNLKISENVGAVI